ncbi:capsid portal protein, partial [Klebsiella pneumoniae]
VRNELIPLQKRISEFNEWIQDDVITFSSYILDMQS